MLFGKNGAEGRQNFSIDGRAFAAIACYLIHGTHTVFIPVVTYTT